MAMDYRREVKLILRRLATSVWCLWYYGMKMNEFSTLGCYRDFDPAPYGAVFFDDQRGLFDL
jgi:hypothetical protein